MSTLHEPQLNINDGACKDLTPAEADKIFFPGSGGKSSQAKKICDSCPVTAMCLQQAIEQGLQGFWAGTTDKERSVMAAHFHIKVQKIEDIMPQVVVKRRVYRRIIQKTEDTLTYLDSLVNPMDVK